MVYLFIIDVHASIIYGGEMDDGDIPQSLSISLYGLLYKLSHASI